MKTKLTAAIKKATEDRKRLHNALATPENFRALRRNTIRLAELTGFTFAEVEAIYHN